MSTLRTRTRVTAPDYWSNTASTARIISVEIYPKNETIDWIWDYSVYPPKVTGYQIRSKKS